MTSTRTNLQTLLENDIGDFLTFQENTRIIQDDDLANAYPSSEGSLSDATLVSCEYNSYHDHVFDTEDDLSKLIENEKKNLALKCGIEHNVREKRGPRGGVHDPFPTKLHKLLEDATKEGLDSIISWLPHGRAFVLNKQEEFTAHVMPLYFKQTKIQSFHRQLNLYGFMRIRHGIDEGAYYHELFLRGKSFLCKAMLRDKFKGRARDGPKKHVAIEPNFYRMPPLNNLAANKQTFSEIGKPTVVPISFSSNISSTRHSHRPSSTPLSKTKIAQSFWSHYGEGTRVVVSLAFQMKNGEYKTSAEEFEGINPVKKNSTPDFSHKIVTPETNNVWPENYSLDNENCENDILLDERLIDTLSALPDNMDGHDCSLKTTADKVTSFSCA